jgi:hypothetical protein
MIVHRKAPAPAARRHQWAPGRLTSRGPIARNSLGDEAVAQNSKRKVVKAPRMRSVLTGVTSLNQPRNDDHAAVEGSSSQQTQSCRMVPRIMLAELVIGSPRRAGAVGPPIVSSQSTSDLQDR